MQPHCNTLTIRIALVIVLLATDAAHAASEDLDFITEHVAEVAMNNGLATLPLWQRSWTDERRWRGFLSGGYNAISAQDMDIKGYMVAAAIEHPLSANWAIRGLLFTDNATLSGSPGTRTLNPVFLRPLPTGLPADAVFGNLDGDVTQYGTGLTATWRNHSGWMDGSEWMGGLLWQHLSINHSTTAYTLVDGTTGTIGYDSSFGYFTLIAGMQWHRRYAQWLFAPHWHLTLPLPRGAVSGRLTGPGFDESSNSAAAGNGHHLGDSYVSLGLSITYLPAHFTVDVGTMVSQYLLEPVIDEGIDQDLVLSMEWSF
jgi:hypothetical protein